MAPAVTRSFRNRTTEPLYHDEEDPSAKGQSLFRRTTFKIDTSAANNPIEALEQQHLKLTPTTDLRDNYWFYFSDKVKAAADAAAQTDTPMTIKLTLLFCVWDQINRAGVRQWFSGSSDSAIITIPGSEDTPRWGWGINPTMIKSLFTKAGLNADFSIRVIAGYSTGYRGMQGSVTNGAIPFDDVQRVIFYDCLYKADDYAAGFRTQDAVNLVFGNNPMAKIIIYEVTEGGTKRYQPGNTLGISDTNTVLINLKPLGPILSALQFARLLDEGVRSGFFAASDVPYLAAFQPLPARGMVTSDPQAAPGGILGGIRNLAGATLLADWGNANAAAIAKLDRKDATETIFNHRLMGWQPTIISSILNDVSSECLHDQFLPEFGWEFLVPD